MPKLTLSSVIAGGLVVVILSAFLPIVFDLIAYGIVAGLSYYAGRKQSPK